MDTLYEHQMKVRDYECDVQGIVNNANYQHYYEVARHEFFEVNGLNFQELHERGCDAVMVSIYIMYKLPLRGATEFVCTVDRLVKDGIKYIFHQQIIRKSDGKVCSIAKVDVACLVNGKLSKPDFLDEKLLHLVS